MKKKASNPEIDTFIVGPRVCGRFDPARDLCHGCVCSGLYKRSICYLSPGASNTVDYEKKQLRALAEIAQEHKP